MCPVDGGGVATLGLWQVLVPQAGQNLVTNPSFETNASNWNSLNATLTRTAGAGVFGAWGGRMQAATLNAFVGVNVASVAGGTLCVASCYVRATSPLVILQLTLGASVLSVAHPGDGLFHRLEVALTAPGTVTPLAQVIDGRASGFAPVDVDGMQFETGVGVATTYIDGDQDGCSWDGAAHASTSTRDPRDGRGGALKSIDSGSYRVDSYKGASMPDLNVVTTDLALGDGAIYQRSLAKTRELSLKYWLLGDGTPAGLHAVRRALLGALQPDLRINRGPMQMRYIGSSVPKRFAAQYVSGLGGGDITASYEQPEVKFTVPDPYALRETEEAALLTPNQSVTGANNLALLNPDGTWSSLAGGVAANIFAQMYVFVRLLDGTYLVGGQFLSSFGGNASINNAGIWNPVGGAWSALTGGSPDNSIVSGDIGPDGTVYVSGPFASIGGVAIQRLARRNPVTGVWSAFYNSAGPGPGTQYWTSMKVDPSTGYVWAIRSGNPAAPTTVDGITVNGCAYWNGSSWVAASAGLPSSWDASTNPQALEVGPDGRMYVAVSAAVSNLEGIYVWTGSSWAAFAYVSHVYALMTARGKLYAAGYYPTIAGVTAVSIAELNPSGGVNTMGGGTSPQGHIFSLARTPDGLVHASGQADWLTIGGIGMLDPMATWNGSIWLPFLANPPDTGTHANDVYNVRSASNGALLVNWRSTAGTFATTLLGQSITSVTNSGSSNAYPIIKLTPTVAATVYAIENLTTGQSILMNASLYANEPLTLDLRQGRKTVNGALRNLVQTVNPASDLATFYLAPGANRIGVYCTDPSAEVVMHWFPRDLGMD